MKRFIFCIIFASLLLTGCKTTDIVKPDVPIPGMEQGEETRPPWGERMRRERLENSSEDSQS